ncbi:MAG: hypothetical protein LBS28_03065, partial [Streptococcaceae bacterium]|nr:hypothetical protein [Streptococcaceae bacterium]
ISHSGKYHSDGGIKWILSEIPMYKDSEKAKNPRFGVKGIAFWDEFERFLIQYQAEEEERIRQAEEST